MSKIQCTYITTHARIHAFQVIKNFATFSLAESTLTLFRKKRFLVNLKTKRNASKFALNLKRKKLHGFSFSINIANFEAFLSVFKLTKNLLLLKSAGLCLPILIWVMLRTTQNLAQVRLLTTQGL